MSTSLPKKRSVKDADLGTELEPPPKRLFSIFDRSANPSSQDESSGPFQWKKLSLFLTSTCLYGENLSPELRTKIAAFDLDGTVIKWASGNDSQWEYWNKKVPQALKEVHDSGYTVVFFSNQCLNEKRLKIWRQKIPAIARSLRDVPFILFAATAKDMYRKPMPGMWVTLEKLATDAGKSIDKSESFFVGDAAGRKGDFSGTDRKFAENLELKFYTPEEYFLNQPALPYTLQGTHINNLLPAGVPRISPTSAPVLPAASKRAEMVLFVGFPASGKSTLFQNVFLPAGYAHVNQDTLGSRPKCLKIAKEHLEKGVSCVIDNTNRDRKTRQHYLDLAKSLDVPIRCFLFKSSKELAWHNNLYRAFCLPLLSEKPDPDSKPRRKLVPYTAFCSFANDFEGPSVEEGFKEVRTVNWIFEGDSREERFWRMWLQVDGK